MRTSRVFLSLTLLLPALVCAQTSPEHAAAKQETSLAAALNEARVIQTLAREETAVAKEGKAAIVVSEHADVCFKKKGALDQKAIVMVSILSGANAGKFQLIQDPLDVTDKGLLSVFEAYSIKNVAEVIRKNGEPLALNYGEKGQPGASLLVLSITAADPATNTLTLIPGPAMEHFACGRKK